MTYDEMEKEISEIPKFGVKASLSNLVSYLEVLGHPEKSLRVIHVAGTNGKGSVCAFLEAILRKAGYQTALFTSPHLVYMKERFRINFQICEEEKLIRAWEKVRDLMEKKEKYGLELLTFFEILFLMAVIIFSEEKIDYCIMETGMGGRLDATALTCPVISVITSISYDHMGILGNTIEQIAGEKAGIIKSGVPVVVLDEDNGAFPVISRMAEEKKSHIYKVRSNEITFLKKYKNKIDFSINCSYYKDKRFQIISWADYQMYNAALAVITARALIPEFKEEQLQEGLLEMRWEGRMEELLTNVYVDGAHNPGAVSQICHSLQRSDDRWILLFAVCGDKDYTSMIKMLAQIPWKRIYITALEETRSASVEAVKSCFLKYSDCPLCGLDTVAEAFSAALHYKNEKDCLLCLGSLYLVGEIKRQKNIYLESEDMT